VQLLGPRSRLMAIVLSESGNNVDVRFKPYPMGLSSGSPLGVASMDGGKGRELGAVSLIVFWRDQSCLQNIVAWMQLIRALQEQMPNALIVNQLESQRSFRLNQRLHKESYQG
jgi:hypothetical protein